MFIWVNGGKRTYAAALDLVLLNNCLITLFPGNVNSKYNMHAGYVSPSEDEASLLLASVVLGRHGLGLLVPGRTFCLVSAWFVKEL